MYPRVAPRRKHVATLLLRPDHPDRKRLSTTRREGPGRATTRAKYEIRFTEWERAGRPHRGDHDPDIDLVDRLRRRGSSCGRPAIPAAAAARRNEPGQRPRAHRLPSGRDQVLPDPAAG